MWQHPDRDRAKVRRVVAGAARNHGVDPQLALAVSWQESGWQMDLRLARRRHRRHAGAARAPAAWMELYAGRRLHLHRLGRQRHRRRPAAARPGAADRLASHRSAPTTRASARSAPHGLYGETRAYVANVLAIKRRLEAGRPPA